MEPIKTVPEMLEEAAATYRERNLLYGDNYKRFGTVMELLFPTGIELVNGDDHNRFGILVQIIAKITRYFEQFGNGGHDDSLLDVSVYANMLRELDAEIRSKKNANSDHPGHRDNSSDQQLGADAQAPAADHRVQRVFGGYGYTRKDG